MSARPLPCRPVDRRRRECHVKRYLIIRCGERFQIGADLIGNVTLGGCPIGAGDAQVDFSRLHQMTADIIGNYRVGDSVMTEFPRRQARSLISRTGFVDPNMDGNISVVCHVDWRSCRAPIDGRQPSRVAMGQNINRFPILAAGDRFDKGEAMGADAAIDLHVLVANFCHFRAGRRGA